MSEPLTLESLNRILDDIFRLRVEKEVTYPRPFVDVNSLKKHEIPYAFDMNGTLLFSSGGLKQAVEVGAVWWVDESGNRVDPPRG